jgi:hypothetical protein
MRAQFQFQLQLRGFDRRAATAFPPTSNSTTTCMNWKLAHTFSRSTSSRAVLTHAFSRHSLGLPSSCRSLAVPARFLQTHTSPATTARAKFRQQHCPSTTVRMATTTSSKEQEWPAQKVRDTFLKFFEDRGHTFGSYIPSTSLYV